VREIPEEPIQCLATDSYQTEKMNWVIALGACHALDIPFNFGLIGSFPWFGGVDYTIFREDNRLGQESLSHAMMDYAAQFARTGNPTATGLHACTSWPRTRWTRAPKFILFDANNNEAVIQMATDVQ